MVHFSEKKYFITTAIAYPNSIPHLGHSLEIVQADCYARFCRLLGRDVIFQTGTDEHGIKNWQTAKKQDRDIMEFLDGNVAVFKEMYQKLGISFDQFIRTSDSDKHYPGAIKLWKRLTDAGDIYKQSYKGTYCAGCEAFKTEKELVDGRCPNHPTKCPEEIEEENYFFRLSKYKDEVISRIRKGHFNVIPESRRNEILSWLIDAKDISFSRPKSSLPWGIPVPGDESQVMYVWCDALANYVTGAGYGTDDVKFKGTWPADVHIIGKDILRFHAAFWPAMLLSAKLELPKALFVHGFVLSKGQKMSKSTGNVIEPFSQIEKYGPDCFRLYMLDLMPMDSDGDYSEAALAEKANTEVVGNLSNFCYRTISFLNKNFGSEIDGIEDDGVIAEFLAKAGSARAHYECFNFKKAIEESLAACALGNKFFQESEPWRLIKEDRKKAHRILGTCLNIAKNLSIMLGPVIPEFCTRLQKQLNVSSLHWKDIDFTLERHKVGRAEMLARRVEDKKEKQFLLSLKAARIISAREHPDAKKLLVLGIDLGNEKRQIVAGLKGYYSAEALAGKGIIVVSNLKYAVLRGIESQGMLLAAEDGKDVGILSSDAKPGTEVLIEGYSNNHEQVSFEAFQKVKMHVKGGKAFFEGISLKAAGKDVFAEKVSEGKIR